MQCVATFTVWALPRSLATTCGIIVIFSSYGYLDVSVPHVRSLYAVYQGRTLMGCPIRISPDQCVFATPRSFSQLITSFFAFESQGILHVPLFAFFFSFVMYHFFKQYIVSTVARCSFASNTSMSSLVENNGFEPLTPCVQSRCSSQLS